MYDTIFGEIFSSINNMMTVVLCLTAGVGAVWCGILYNRYSKEKKKKEKEEQKRILKNRILLFAMIFVMLAAIRIAMPYAAAWIGTKLAA